MTETAASIPPADQSGSTDPAASPAPPSRSEATATLTAPGQTFEMDQLTIRGIPTRTWKNAPATLRTVLELSALHGDKDFLVYEDERVTFAEHFRIVAALGHALAERYGIAAGDRVAIAMRNLPEWVMAFWAAISVGAVVVPLNAWWTGPELAYGLLDSGTSVVFVDEEREARIRPHLAELPSLRTVIVTSEEPAPGGGRRTPTGALAERPGLDPVPVVPFTEAAGTPGDGLALPAVDLDPDDDATIFYTSGTTGTPKGVLVGSKAFAAAVGSAIDALGLDEATRALCVSPFHFDGSFGTLFPTLVAGGTAVIRPREALLFVRPFFDALVREQVTFTGFSPSYLRLLLGSKRIGELSGTSLETVAIGGEASSAADVRALLSAAPSLRVFNRYGPTESTIAVTHARLTLESIEDGVVPIGSPHPGVSFHLLGDGGKPVEDVGEVGELYVGGVQLMEGYWAAPELSSEVLRTDVVPGRTVYRTGDLAYRDATRGYVYVGRCDRVVKRSGVRISLVEIGDAIQDLAGASSSTCALFDDEGSPGIVVFLVVGHPVLTDDLRERARDLLPEPMVPDRIEVVDGFPLTHTGKLDERSLLDGVGLRPPRRADGPRLPGR